MTSAPVSYDNNFRIIRHVAASAVIFSHAFVLVDGVDNLVNEPLEGLTGVSFAELAVNIFFVASGYLVTQSILSRGSLVTYLISRGLRIYPALIAVVFLTALVLGPLVTSLSISEYFTTKSVYAYIFYDASALQPFKMRFELPGVFTTNPYPNAVNASLWTLPWEIWMYLVLAGLFVLRLLRGAWLMVFWLLVMACHAAAMFDIIELGVHGEIALRFLAYFFSGALFYKYQKLLPLTLSRQIAMTAIFTVFTFGVQNATLLPLFVAHTTLFLAFYRPIVVRRLSKGADISYGIYLYAYPVQQALVMFLGPHDPYLNTLLSFIITAPLAALSWYYVEKPALALKPILIDRVETFKAAKVRA